LWQARRTRFRCAGDPSLINPKIARLLLVVAGETAVEMVDDGIAVRPSPVLRHQLFDALVFKWHRRPNRKESTTVWARRTAKELIWQLK
jgi:hypothetical protein